jgi:2-polyprenyl-6-methoxyphenol hydroxylase-like FAD-dependent oxidoreductase
MRNPLKIIIEKIPAKAGMTNMKRKGNILIIGAGLCGSLLALRLGQRGYNITIMEMRADLRKVDISAGRSINLAFSDRGIKAMRLVGIRWTVNQSGIFRSWHKSNEAGWYSRKG